MNVQRRQGEGMKLRTFQAPSMSEALAQVKTTMGRDAVILHTRTISKHRWLGLRRREIVEITAGRDLRVQERTVRKIIPNTPAAPAALPNPAPRPASMNMPTPLMQSRQLLETP